jgi:hypothetical protein
MSRKKTLDPGAQAQDASFADQGTGSRRQGIGKRLQGTGQGLQGAGNRRKGTGQGQEGADNRRKGAGNRRKGTGHGMVSTGHGMESAGQGLQGIGQGLEGIDAGAAPRDGAELMQLQMGEIGPEDLVICADDGKFYWVPKATYKAVPLAPILEDRPRQLLTLGCVIATVKPGTFPGIGSACYVINLPLIRKPRMP